MEKYLKLIKYSNHHSKISFNRITLREWDTWMKKIMFHCGKIAMNNLNKLVGDLPHYSAGIFVWILD